MRGRARVGLDADAVGAVLEAAGLRAGRRRAPGPAGLTAREVRGPAARSRAGSSEQGDRRRSSHLSPKTVGHHVAHVYAKAGVSTRAAAALFAVEHGLLQP